MLSTIKDIHIVPAHKKIASLVGKLISFKLTKYNKVFFYLLSSGL